MLLMLERGDRRVVDGVQWHSVQAWERCDGLTLRQHTCVKRCDLNAACRFGGIEGLRGMCVPRVMVQDRLPWIMKTALPPPLQYPVASYGFQFVHALCKMFYGSSVGMRVSGLLTLARVSLFPPQTKAKQA